MSGPFPDAGDRLLLHGVVREARAGYLATLAQAQAGRTVLILAASAVRAQELYGEGSSYAGWMDAGDIFSHFPEAPDEDIDGQRRADRICDRLSVLSLLLDRREGATRAVCLTPEALLAPCPPRKPFESNRIHLKAGGSHPFDTVVRKLSEDLGYDAEALCEYPGQFAVRGGLIDIYPVDALQPVRVDFFGDEIESLRSFDPATQRTLEAVVEITIPSAGGSGDEGEEAAGFLDYLPNRDLVWVLEDPDQLVRNYPLQFENRPRAGGAPGTLQAALAARADAKDALAGLCEIDTEPLLFAGAERKALSSEASANYRVYPDISGGGIDRLDSEVSARTKFEIQIADWAAKEKLSVHFAVSSRAEAERITEHLSENPLCRKLKPNFHEGPVPGGFIARYGESCPPWIRLPGSADTRGHAVITDNEYFGRHRRTPGRSRERLRPTLSQVDQLLDFSELADGDPLVHLQNGVCLFRGLSRIEIDGGQKEVISVEFAEAMTLHVPLHESHLLTRYVGLSKTRPKLAKVGAAGWQKTRQAAERAALDYAAELLNLQARRADGAGHAFPVDQPWQRSFEANFPYRETVDQMRAIVETKGDMEAARPMDRLICGDVGFGKTEVAIRAAFKAVLDGKQVAVLVPTTVLCQQHYNTFRERMAEYPFTIEMVSRFRTAGQNKTILDGLAGGRIDIVIGTHRLLSRDVHFRDLGLLVCDEEQRFGVKQKERIKQLRANVDVLTLSATPIPRTLYLAMAGARSMSVIETPPVDRRPIETVVKRYSPELVKSAIQAETDRGGQVFYLHNRVATIERTAKELREMLPRLRIAVGHGQMGEHVLERVMTRFVAGEYDVLVCTTIIESGLDLPNCNTLLIEGADRFGLAQLYQLRGRVGRFKRQAYAYLLLHRHGHVVEEAHKRLNALKQHNQLGAGYRIAMRDLELRGAGNLLGSEQSGHIAGVGFELYCQLLRQSVARLKGDPGADRIRAEVKLDFIASGEGGGRSRRTSGSAGFAAIKEAEYERRQGEVTEAVLPDDYIGEARLRIDLYRRLALADDEAAVGELAAELADRFGPLPPATDALVAVSRIRVLAEAAGVRRVETEGDRLICRFATPGRSGEYLKAGTRFPRLTAKDPLLRLAEISKFLRRHVRP